MGLISSRVLGATPGRPPASHHLSHTPPPIRKDRRGFWLPATTASRMAVWSASRPRTSQWAALKFGHLGI